jgi:pimeloyl-ACP methyl ester carboxylesterase
MAWWTDARYGDAVLAIMNGALTQAIQQLQNQPLKNGLANDGAAQTIRLRLIGYSGGGVIAALLAQQRDDVACLVTVAAPLDLRAWAKLQGLSPLNQSQNPATTVIRHANLAQTHWYGKEDRIVPPQALGDYGLQGVGLSAMEVHFLPGYDHRSPWAENWRRLLGQSCQDGTIFKQK